MNEIIEGRGQDLHAREDAAEGRRPQVVQAGGRRPDENGLAGELRGLDLGLETLFDPDLGVDDRADRIGFISPLRSEIAEDHRSRAVQGDIGRIEPCVQEPGQDERQAGDQQPVVFRDERQAPVDGVAVGNELDVAQPHGRLGQLFDGQRDGSCRRYCRAEGGSGSFQGPALEERSRARIGLLLVPAEENGQQDIPGAGHRLGQELIVLDAVGRAFGQHEVEEDGLGPAGLEKVQQRSVDLPRPRPAESLLLFEDVQAGLVHGHEDDIGGRAAGIGEELQTSVPGFPLQGPERPRGVQEDGQGEDGQPDGRAAEDPLPGLGTGLLVRHDGTGSFSGGP